MIGKFMPKKMQKMAGFSTRGKASITVPSTKPGIRKPKTFKGKKAIAKATRQGHIPKGLKVK